jgi:hypothetical protein
MNANYHANFLENSPKIIFERGSEGQENKKLNRPYQLEQVIRLYSHTNVGRSRSKIICATTVIRKSLKRGSKNGNKDDGIDGRSGRNGYKNKRIYGRSGRNGYKENRRYGRTGRNRYNFIGNRCP